ncbi:MAG: histidine kinase [Acidimicrobiia bacterium]
MSTSGITLERSRSAGASLVGASIGAVLATGLAVVAAVDDVEADALFAVVVGAWALAAVFVASQRPAERLWIWTLGVAGAGAVALVAPAAAALVPFAAFALVVVLPDGRVARATVGLFAAAAVIAIVAGFVGADVDSRTSALAVESIVLGVIALVCYVRACRLAGTVVRSRLQWVGWGVVVAAGLVLCIWLLDALLEWPSMARELAIGATLFVPLALAMSSVETLAVRIDRLLVHTVEAGGVVIMVATVYIVIVLGFGEAPDSSERRVLGLSIIAGIVAALLYAPTRSVLSEAANRRVYGERRAPDEPLQTFGARMSRAIPLEELLLQLAESLKKSMQLAAAEVWTGTGGVFECAASVPFREPPRMRLDDDEVGVVARAHVSGNAWLQVWLPSLLAGHEGRTLRVAPLAHSGELLGMIVCARAAGEAPFTEDQDRVLTELARPVALALHNSRLDTALQASLDDLRIANEELRASRARIVAAADSSRRQIERNLHDGAQQHLVALAVKLGLARQLLDADPATVASMLEELRGDAQETLTQLRELAHGIYPPLLMDRGLGEALRAAANRAVLHTDVVADVGRYGAEVEAAVYFCCLEALQNAGKHAGEGARVTISVDASDGEVAFEVADTGTGFDASGIAARGHGFMNMADRLGAIGGVLEVESAPGAGTHVRGRMPIDPDVADD